MKPEDWQFDHPALTMSTIRAKAWEKYGTDEQFYKYVMHLARIYAKRKYDGKGKIDDNILFKDFKQYRDGILKEQ